MQEKDFVEVVVEKNCYAQNKVHKGMQGEIYHELWMDDSLVVRFPEFGGYLYTVAKSEDLRLLPDGIDSAVNEQISANYGELPPDGRCIKETDIVELVEEKACYAKDKVHKGMQGEVYSAQYMDGTWVVRFPEFGGHLYTVAKAEDLRVLSNGINSAINEQISEVYGETPPGKKRFMEMDCVEVIVEKDEYVQEGVHKGMQGWICHPEFCNGEWLVNFPQCGEKPDIATIAIKEDDLERIQQLNAKVNENLSAERS